METDFVAPVTHRKPYVAGLDGIRAVAVIAVLFAHSVIRDQGLPHLNTPGREAGYTGVTLFFVLSGYLITSLLIREEDTTGTVSLRLFYIRRALRLLPAVWLYLLVVAALKLTMGLPNQPWYDFVSCLFYFRNLIGRGSETGHLWTLSLEEQFYFLWPLVFVYLAHQNRARLMLAAATSVGITFWRVYAANHGAAFGTLYIRPDFRFDGPLSGCILALVLRIAPQWVEWLNCTSLRSATLANVAMAGLVFWVALGIEEHVYPGLGPTIAGVLAVALILSQLGAPSLGSSWLTWWPLLMIGRISYGVYLWQGLFLSFRNDPLDKLRHFPIGILLTFTAATLSYFLLEKPLLSLKDRRFHKPCVAEVGAVGNFRRAHDGEARVELKVSDPTNSSEVARLGH
jgi:peptidoglycan/LPS O-acetylase OafA/YrhL